MSLITYTELTKLAIKGVIENVRPEHINAASIDLTLGDTLRMEETQGYKWCNLAKKETPPMEEVPLAGSGHWHLYPGDFALASTREIFHLPNDIAAEFKLKSSLARSGLDHALAGWCDPGWHDATLTLEIKNICRSTILTLTPGMKIGQIVLWRGEPVPDEASYAARGQYNGQRDATESKGVR